MENKINTNSFEIEQLNQEFYDAAILFLENIFYKEQNIPKKLIPIQNKNKKIWCIRNHNEVVGIAAAWEIKSEWHWGRLAIHKDLRGLGLGKIIAQKSIDELFRMGIEEILIDARDITVDMILKMGGKITGEKTNFYGYPITPMKILKTDFIHNTH